MSELSMPLGTEPREILQATIEKKTPAIMSYLSKRKWHVTKVLLTDLGANRLSIQVLPRKNPHPLNIQVNQPVGISLKYGYGKFIFETTVEALEPSPKATSGGTIVLKVPERIEIVQRRNYFRVDVPHSLKVTVLLWHRSSSESEQQVPPENYWQGRLADISAGGAQIVVETAQKPDFKKGQFIGLRFTPMPYEMPLMFDAQIRNILPTADDKSICLGLQIVGLEASPEGRQTLQRLCNVVEKYYQINQSNAKQQDFQTTKLIADHG
ncbi:MAG: PilZ domain-containing protein [Planctomycetota bacterium]|nr:MAG: PilZ domain-containing protein [Planctomycetota bacterium]